MRKFQALAFGIGVSVSVCNGVHAGFVDSVVADHFSFYTFISDLRASLVAQLLKNLLVMWESWV